MQFIVTALTGDLCQSVRIRPADSIYIAIYSRIFGPATQQECADFVEKHAAECMVAGSRMTGDAGRPFPWRAPNDARGVQELASAAAGSDGPAGKVLVSTVERGEFALLLSAPPKLSIVAFGEVPTLGYSEPEVRVFGSVLAADGVVTAGVFAKPPSGFAADVISPVTAEGLVTYNADAITAVHLVGSQESLLCLPGNDGPFSRQVNGNRLVRGEGELVAGVECFLIVTGRDTYSIGRALPTGCAEGDRVKFTGVRMDVSFCMQGTPLSLLSATKV